MGNVKFDVMNARVTYLQSLPESIAIPPAISNITSSPANPIPHANFQKNS